jgi:hypothetical protein
VLQHRSIGQTFGLLGAVPADRQYQRQSNEARALMHARIVTGFKALYGLMWKAAFGVIVALAGIVLFLTERFIE